MNGAVKKLLNDDGVIAWYSGFESAQFWRDDRFWTPEVDTLLSTLLIKSRKKITNVKIIVQIYSKYQSKE